MWVYIWLRFEDVVNLQNHATLSHVELGAIIMTNHLLIFILSVPYDNDPKPYTPKPRTLELVRPLL